jgi:MSHA biogenesis protein MshN
MVEAAAVGRIAMSVVNRMLQDIDRRLGEAGIAPMTAHPGVRSVPAATSRGPRNRRAAWMLAGLIVAGAAIALASGGWRPWWEAPAPVPVPRFLPRALPAAALASVEVAPLEAAAADTLTAAPAIHADAAREAPAAVPAPRPALRARSAETLRLSLNLSSPAPGPRPAAASATRRTEVPARQVAADETVLAARALWNEGANAAALATLREALAAAEGSRNPAAASSIARELARLEVAGNRPRAALDLLVRMEPVIGEDADAWALRGNAEQRLALHAEAAASYLAALRLKPAEGKWMLGAAISLAAAGEPDAARAWVERARERGAITPPIAAYLQQLGIAANR